MLTVDLSTLSGPELRQLLDTTRDRGQAALSYQVLQEMAARRERREQERAQAPKLLRGRRRSEPRVIELNLGDPLEKKDLDFDDDVPDLPRADHDPVSTLTLERAPDPGPPPRRRPRFGRAGFVMGVAVGLAAGGALGVGVAEITHSPDVAPRTALAAYPPAPPAPTKAATLPLVVEAPPAPEIPTDVAAAPAPEPVEVAALAEAEAPAEEVVAPPVEKPPEKKIEVAAAEETAPPVSRHCAGQPTPADRTICEAPELQRLQRDLRQAYARAMEVHEDRDILRQRQLAWADARKTVTDPARLAALYEQRIRRLNAATADAEARR